MADSAPHDPRFYYQPIARLYMRGYAVFGFVVWLALTAAPRLSFAIRLVVALFAFGYLYIAWRLGGRGLEARRDGIRYRRWLQWRFIPWPEVRGFSIKQAGALSPTVFVDLVSGESRIMPFAQGRLTRWKGGKTRDTVAVLNSELDGVRAAT